MTNEANDREQSAPAASEGAPSRPEGRTEERPSGGFRRGGGGGGGGGGFRGRGGGRRKVCAFCVDKVDVVDYKDPGKLRRYISDRGKIDPRRKTGTCARHQRRLTVAIKRARHLALLPYTADHARAGGGQFGRPPRDRDRDRGGDRDRDRDREPMREARAPEPPAEDASAADGPANGVGPAEAAPPEPAAAVEAEAVTSGEPAE